jgi:hypothetical protein
MKLQVKRTQCRAICTIGEFYIDGELECFTLEDQVRPFEEHKVFGLTAIPYGTYDVDVTFSPHFGRLLPLVKNVPGFEGVRIHPGNTAADTEGCLLLGTGVAGDTITNSRKAFDAAYEKIKEAHDKGERITIEYTP